ncbi:MAG: hypothetical protein RL514_1272 [Verrucomicrobiota bacterium]|jgi:hypothetical protein
MNQEADAIEVCALLTDQKEVLWRIHHTATEPPGKLNAKADLANFLLCHALHVHEMAKAALVLMQNREPYGVAILGRSALESAFNLVASMKDRQFGPQRIALELEDLAWKLKLLLERGTWVASRRPTPEDCNREANRVRAAYSAPKPTDREDLNRIERIKSLFEKEKRTNPLI